jgi:hypothetical protein
VQQWHPLQLANFAVGAGAGGAGFAGGDGTVGWLGWSKKVSHSQPRITKMKALSKNKEIT